MAIIANNIIIVPGGCTETNKLFCSKPSKQKSNDWTCRPTHPFLGFPRENWKF